MEGRKIQWLVIVIMVMVFEGCSFENPPVPPLNKVIEGSWEPTVYMTDPLAGWKEINSLTGRAEVTITDRSIVIHQYDRYNESKYISYELEIASFGQDTLRTGDWITDPWRVFEANEALYRRDETDHDGSIWLQSGMHQIIMDKMKHD